jgi:hypothetical protein
VFKGQGYFRLLPQDRPASLEEVRRFALHAGREEQDLAGEQAMGGSSSGSQPREGGHWSRRAFLRLPRCTRRRDTSAASTSRGSDRRNNF